MNKSILIKNICKGCGKEFHLIPCYAKVRFFCSLPCYWRYSKEHRNKGMFQKGNPSWIKGTHIQTNTGKTHFTSERMKGVKNVNWNNGYARHSSGYILLSMPEHPFTHINSYYPEHRYACECILGRFLDPDETVHHINEIKDDNDPDNLYLFSSNGEHGAYHKLFSHNKTERITKSNLNSHPPVSSQCN